MPLIPPCPSKPPQPRKQSINKQRPIYLIVQPVRLAVKRLRCAYGAVQRIVGVGLSLAKRVRCIGQPAVLVVVEGPSVALGQLSKYQDSRPDPVSVVLNSGLYFSQLLFLPLFIFLAS